MLRRRSFLHLGTEVARTGGVPGDRSALAVRTVKRLHVAAEDAGADVVVALATAALRDAANGTRLLARMERILGSPIILLSGEEEARLCFLGQRAGVWVGDRPVLGLDLGGGSLEAGIGTIDTVAAVASVALGTARIRGELDTGERLTPGERAAIGALTAERADPIAEMLADPRCRRPGHRQRRDGPGPGPPGHGSPPLAHAHRVVGPLRSIRSSSPPTSCTTWPIACPPSTSTPAWRCPASRPAGRRCCPSAPWCCPPWSTGSTCAAWS